METLFCTSCGQRRHEQDHFCGHCGHCGSQFKPHFIAHQPVPQKHSPFTLSETDLDLYEKHEKFLKYTHVLSYLVAAVIIYLGLILPNFLNVLGLYFFNLSSIFTVGTIIFVIVGGHRYITQTMFGLHCQTSNTKRILFEST